MQDFLESIWAKIIRLVLTASVVVMGSLPFSYMKEIPQFHEDGTLKAVDIVRSSYFIFEGNGLMDWMPIICIFLSVGALITAIYSMFQETESVLLWLTRFLCFALVAQAVILIFLSPTAWGWGMACALLVAVALTAVQEMKLEDKNKNNNR